MLQRKPDSHKGDFGHILIIAGSNRYPGAASLCCEAAFRAGAGLVTLAIPEKLVNAFIRIKPKEGMLLPLPQTKGGGLSSSAYPKLKEFIKKIDMVAIGPGLGREKTTAALIRKVLSACDKPAVVDADGLNAAIGRPDLLEGRIITPHPGEFSRLTGKPVKNIQNNRKKVAQSFSCSYNATVVLKGNKTIVASPDGRIYTNNTGNPGMACAGSGDVLTGMIAALTGQGLDGFEAAKSAVYLHGLAGDLAADEMTQISMKASDIINHIPEAIKKSR